MRNTLVEAPEQVKRFRDFVKDVKKVDNREDSWRGSLKDLMGTIGFRPVGMGKYAFVFEKPNYPYVVKIFMKDTAYLRWISFCLKHPNNKYVPKIRGKVIKINDIFMAIRLEKLAEQSSYDFVSKLYAEDEAGDHDAREVVDYLESNQKLLDLHGGNFMVDSQGQYKLIDPFYNWYRNGSFTIDPDDLSNLKHIF